MAGIDFSKIRSDSDSGQRGCFEEFICQLARRDQPNTENCEFRRVEGSGGDGGVEAYWLCTDGSKIGYQAKYWLRTRDINWGQIDKSVRQAIQTHPKLTRYIVAIPCDLTDKTGEKDKNTGRKKSDERVAKWKSEATNAGIKNLKFDFWGKSELHDRAINHLLPGAITYWFDATILDAYWFEEKRRKVVADLGVRYVPITNVDTGVVHHFDSFLRKDQVFDEVENLIDDIAKRWTQYLSNLNQWCSTDDMQVDFDKLVKDIDQLQSSFSRKLPSKKGWIAIKDTLDEITKRSSSYAFGLARKISNNEKESPDNRYGSLDNIADDLRQFGGRLSELGRIVRKPHLLAYDKSVFLLAGSFGTGKSHALGRLLEAEIGVKTPMVLFLGQQFVKGNPEQQIVEKTGIASLKTFSEFLGALNARAEACGKIGIIAIDAINEGDGLDIWPKHLAGILEEIAHFPFIKTIVSCRSEFIKATVPKSVQNDAHICNLQGFENDDDDDDEDAQERALVRFMDEQGINRPSAPFFPPAFNNPLFVSTICGALQEQGKTDFPDGIEGMITLIDFYLENIGKTIARQHKLDDNLEIDIVRGIRELAKEMANKRQPTVLRDEAIKILNGAISTSAPNGKNWLDMILKTGCLINYPIYDGESSRIKGARYAFSYQSFSDFLIADELFKSRQGNYDKMFEPDGALSFMIGDDNFWARIASVYDGEVDDDANGAKNYCIDSDWLGVFTMLWIIFAENKKGELAELLPIAVRRDNERTLDDAFVDGLFWRSPASITQKTTEYRDAISEPHWLFSEPFWLASHFWAIPNHPWDAFALSEELKQYAIMAERDAKWTIFVKTNYEYRSSISKLIEWSLVQKNAPTKEVAIRIMVVFGWCLATTHLKLRDRVTKALVHMLRLKPNLMSELFKEFAEVDDLYIRERLLAAIYGACQFVDKESNDIEHVGNVAKSVYDTIFAGGNPPLHLLVRDYAQGIIERADYLNALPKGVDLYKCTPPYRSHYPQEFQNNTPGTLYTNEAIDNLAESVGDKYKTIAGSCTTEYGGRMYGDFGRYVLQSNVYSFCTIPIDQPLPEEVEYDNKFNGELIGNWVARRVYEHYGWKDTLFSNERSTGDRHNNIIERIGKKYQWIAMYELLGILADHVYVHKGWGCEAKKYASIEDLDFVRDIDPTVSAKGIEQDKRPELHNFDVVETLPDESADRSELKKWVLGKKVIVDDLKNRIVSNIDGQRWYMLHGHDSKRIRATQSGRIMNTEFFRLSTNCVSKENMTDFLKENHNKRLADPTSPTEKDPLNLFQGKFLFEMDWRNVPENIEYGSNFVGVKDIRYFQPVYECISPKENQETGRYRDILPHPSIMVRFGLKIDRKHSNLIKNQEGKVVFYTYDMNSEDGFQEISLIDADLFDEFLKENNLVCVWLLGGKRQTDWDVRSFSSMAWMENGKVKTKHWHEDSCLNGPR